MVNWYWVRLTVLSRVRSCAGCMYSATPAMSAVSDRSRRIASATFVLRSPRGFKLIKKRAVQSDIVAVDADEGRQAEHIPILENAGRHTLLPLAPRGLRKPPPHPP